MSQLSPFHAQFEAWFEDKDMTAKQAWRLLLEEHDLMIGYTTVKSYVHTYIRKIGKALTVRMETPPGHQAQVDFGYVGLMVAPQTGRRRKAWAFIMVLSHSRHRFVRFVFGQDSPTWIDCHRRAFESFDGVPETVVLDNLKAGVIKADIYDPTINRAYAECGEHYGFLIDPAKVRMARHKGKVERQVPVVRQQVLAGRKFADIHEANPRPPQVPGRSRHDRSWNDRPQALRGLPERGAVCLEGVANRAVRDPDLEGVYGPSRPLRLLWQGLLLHAESVSSP